MLSHRRIRQWAAPSIALAVMFASTASAQESPYLYGIHDHDTNPQEYLDRIKSGGATGWVTATVAIGHNPNDHGGQDFSWLANQGFTVITRLNNGYCPNGTIPVPSQYANFAQRAANFVANSTGCEIWLIGNETNLPWEWPAVGGHANYVSPQDYADCFRQVYNAIKAVRPNHKVISQALAPWAGPIGAGSACGYTHDALPLNWVTYLNQMLTAIDNTGPLDGIALHINSRGYTYNDIHSTQKINAGGQELFFSFYVYKDWVDLGIPQNLWHLPLYATECNGNYFWKGGHAECSDCANPSCCYQPGWMQEIYAEIDRYNQDAINIGKPIYRCINMYRWCAWCDGWNIDGAPQKGQILADLDQAVASGYTWPTAGGPPPPPPPPPDLDGDNLALNATQVATSSNFSQDFTGAKAIDGIISSGSKWVSDGSSPPHWLALDLGGNKSVNGFMVRHAGAGGEPAYFNTRHFQLQSSSSFSGPWTDEFVVNNSAEADVTVHGFGSPKILRYVRLYITDPGIDNYTRIPEFEVWGDDISEDMLDQVPTGANLALNATQVGVSSQFGGSFGGDKAIDGVVDAGSKWVSDGSPMPEWLRLDLGADRTVNGFIVHHAEAGGEAWYMNTAHFTIQSGASFDGPWTNEVVVDNSVQDPVTHRTYVTPKTLRYVRLLINDAGIDNYVRLPEFEVRGDAGGPSTIAEDFETMPSWASTFNAGWGSAASWSIVGGGQSGNALSASRSSQGSSSRVLVYNISPNTSYTISIYMRAPSSSNTWWAESAFRLGNHSAENFDQSAGAWTLIQKFSNDGINGNGNNWTQYSVNFNSGGNTQISVGVKHGAAGGTGPTVQWDTLRID